MCGQDISIPGEKEKILEGVRAVFPIDLPVCVLGFSALFLPIDLPVCDQDISIPGEKEKILEGISALFLSYLPVCVLGFSACFYKKSPIDLSTRVCAGVQWFLFFCFFII